jgi:hypothetical protein
MGAQSCAQLIGQLLSSTDRIFGKKQSAGTLTEWETRSIRENIIVGLLKPFSD